MIDAEKQQRLEDAIRRAGQKLLAFWPGRVLSKEAGPLDLGALRKADGSFVTQADYASNEILVETLGALFPDDVIVSEEMPLPDPDTLHGRIWIIDPLDGTKSFMEGNDDFSILAALCQSGKAEFGVMHFPARSQYAVGAAGRGATLDGITLQVSRSAEPRSRCVYGRHLPAKGKTEEIFYDRWVDSGCAFLNVARGIFDGVIIRIVNHREWDLAAPAIVLAESGGRVSDGRGNDIRFDRPIDYRYFIASNGIVHEQLVKLVQSWDGEAPGL